MRFAGSIATIDMTSQPSKPQKPVKASKPPSGQKVKTWDNDNAESVSTPPVPNVLPNGNYACVQSLPIAFISHALPDVTILAKIKPFADIFGSYPT